VKYQISQNGGAWPIWTAGGHELLYRLQGTPARLNVISIATAPVPAFTADRQLPIQGAQAALNNREYDAFPRSNDLVMVFPATRTETTPPQAITITTVLNWTEELKARVPTKRR
jgi:hypothetical protein